MLVHVRVERVVDLGRPDAEALGEAPDAGGDERRLSDGLRRVRELQRLTQTQLAKKLSSSQSRVAKMEAGDRSVSLDLLVRSLFALGSRAVSSRA